jgi:predicted enzyme involved in methoxymalonyl-ACP biosynthesis
VTDKYGDSGITGLGIISLYDDICNAKVDTFLMSCRIIGRNIEYAFMDYIIKEIKDKKIINLSAEYIKTQKNKQVEDFYNECSFDLTCEDELHRSYVLKVGSYKSKQINYIEVINGKYN